MLNTLLLAPDSVIALASLWVPSVQK